MEKKIGVDRSVIQSISKNNLEISFVATGDIHTIKSGNIFLNQLVGQEIDGSLNKIYLRIFEGEVIHFFPLIGEKTSTRFFIGNSQAKWLGNVAGINYEIKLKLASDCWFWEVTLDGQNEMVDLVYVNDIGLSDGESLRSNEAYNAQYINHQIFEKDGFKIFSRQNQLQSTGFPTLETGAFGDLAVDGFLTDGFQFFGKSFKLTRVPEALTKAEFDNEIYQYELAVTALKTERLLLQGKTSVTFYELYQPTSTDIAQSVSLLTALSVPLDEVLTEVSLTKAKIDLSRQLNGQILSNDTLRSIYPEAKFEEVIGNQLVSGFTRENTHFVSLAKELLVEREHGEIFLSGNSMSIKNRGLATSSFIYGLFNAQLVIGNTTMNKLLSNQRDHLNLHQVSGQRIFVNIDGAYQMLGLPSTFEMGYNFAQWTYVVDGETIVVKNFVANAENSLQLEVLAQSGKSYDFLILNQITMDEMEYKSNAQLTALSADTYDFTAGENSSSKIGNPQLKYRLKFDQAVKVLSAERLFDRPTFIEDSLVIFSVSADSFKLKITGALDGAVSNTDFLNFSQEKQKYHQFIEKDLLHGFRFTSPEAELEKSNTILPWYAHDMLIHYLSPHGLEQYGGAAWGTRDVSQGPIEFFLATQHPDVAREILLELFSHQFQDDGTWPQWFMFDEYQSIFSGESHGDVIVWPFFAVAEYLERTGDFELISELLPYVSRLTNTFTSEKETLKQHLQKELQYIKDNFLTGTHLSAYGNGDWDDTLQPANPRLKEHMTSSWTDALTYQALKKYAKVIKKVQPEEAAELDALAEQIKRDFEHYLVLDGIIPGFALQNEAGQFEPIIHPKDSKTNIQYRLLPMNRSIIAEISDKAQMQQNLKLIDENLVFNDGVRLMNHSPEYHGGVSINFKRAEQAANFGREIGLLYVHAQIRYVEAMAKVGEAKKAWKALEQTIPAGIYSAVSNAEPRQANVYFSSSDGDFRTRYEAQNGFDQLKSGTVGVKGGWRLYSSGPGIFTNQVISHLAGVEKTADGLVIDPTFPENTDKLDFDFVVGDKMVHFLLKKSTDKAVSIDQQAVSFETLANPYRIAGVKIRNEQFTALKDGSTITVTL